MDDKTNDAHDIHIRAMKAAEIINMKYGWKQPQEIRDMRKAEIKEECQHILEEMKEFNIKSYFNALSSKGYEVKPRYDNSGKMVGYTIGMNASVFKASEIGRKFMVSKIEDTWKKLHPAPAQTKRTMTGSSASQTIRPTSQSNTSTHSNVQPKPVPDYKILRVDGADGEPKDFKIPNKVLDIFANEAQVPEGNDIATVMDVSQVALMLFIGYVDAATSMSISCGGGGGSSPESGWGKDKDEDDLQFARRCLKMAHSMCQPQQHYRRRR